MARRNDRPGSVVTVRGRLNLMFERLFTRLFLGIGFIVSWSASLFACLFAAEVAVGRKLTKRDPLPVRHRPEPEIRRATFLLRSPAGHPAPLNTAAGRGVDILGPAAGPCPITGARPAGLRARERARGYFRCIHFPSCKHQRLPSRISKVSVQDWLKLNQPFPFQPPRRRPRGS